MTFEDCAKGVPESIKQDSLWRVEAYRLSLFMADLAWEDATKLLRDRRTVGLADQLVRSAGNISSSIGEGYSRGTGRDRARFYEYSLGSARESRDWYYKARHMLEDAVVNHRLELASQVIRLTLTMIAHERRTNRRVMPRP